MTEKILITGGAGFIGFHVAKRVLQEGTPVVILDNFNDYYETSLKRDRIKELKKSHDVEIAEIDLADYNRVEGLFKKNRFDKVCHLGAQAGVRYSLENPEAYISSNITGTFNILKLMSEYGVKDLVFASSSSVYGGNEKTPFSEEDKTDFPVSFYAATKKAGEEMAYTYHHLFKINVTILRFFTVYGPWGRPDMGCFSFFREIKEGREVNLFNKGKMKRDFTYIDDTVDGIFSAINNPYPYEIINLGNDNPVELEQFISQIEEITGKKAKKRYLPMQKGDVKETWADISKAQRLLNYNPKTSTKEGLKKFSEWYKEYYNK